MKAAIYSRVMDEDQQKDVQLFFDELDKPKNRAGHFHQPFLNR